MLDLRVGFVRLERGEIMVGIPVCGLIRSYALKYIAQRRIVAQLVVRAPHLRGPHALEHEQFPVIDFLEQMAVRQDRILLQIANKLVTETRTD